jgi:hypothetical protein
MLGYIRETTTTTGIKVKAVLDAAPYKKGQKIQKDNFEQLQLSPHIVCPRWNYTITPKAMNRRQLKGPLQHMYGYKTSVDAAWGDASDYIRGVELACRKETVRNVKHGDRKDTVICSATVIPSTAMFFNSE